MTSCCIGPSLNVWILFTLSLKRLLCICCSMLGTVRYHQIFTSGMRMDPKKNKKRITSSAKRHLLLTYPRADYKRVLWEIREIETNCFRRSLRHGSESLDLVEYQSFWEDCPSFRKVLGLKGSPFMSQLDKMRIVVNGSVGRFWGFLDLFAPSSVFVTDLQYNLCNLP